MLVASKHCYNFSTISSHMHVSARNEKYVNGYKRNSDEQNKMVERHQQQDEIFSCDLPIHKLGINHR
jgi:hypothetical protein